MLDKILKRLNLSNDEIRVYISLLQSGDLTAGKLAKHLNFPRSTLYGYLSTLADKGLISQSELNGVKLWHAATPDQLSHLIDREIDHWEDARENFKNILPILKQKFTKGVNSPKFQLFEGVNGVRQLLNDLLLYPNIITELVWPSRDLLEAVGDDYMSSHNRRRIRQKIYIKSIWPEDKITDFKKKQFLGVGKEFFREIRIAPKGFSCSMGYWAYADKVAFISSKKESFGFLVESKEFRMLTKAQFDVIWPLSRKIDVPLSITKDFLKTV